MRHRHVPTPAYLVWVDHRPSSSGKGKTSYYAAVDAAARQEIEQPITAQDIELEIVYSTRTPPAERLDADNVNKPTLDALKGVAYRDDAQVRSVTVTLFDRSLKHVVDGRVEYMGRLFYSPLPDVVLIMIYSDSRLEELGGEKEVQRRRYEAWQREFDRALGIIKEEAPA
jgi:hypothetical protein